MIIRTPGAAAKAAAPVFVCPKACRERREFIISSQKVMCFFVDIRAVLCYNGYIAALRGFFAERLPDEGFPGCPQPHFKEEYFVTL